MVSARFEFRFDSLKSISVLILFVYKLIIGSSKNNRENYPRKWFWRQEKETRVKFNPGLSANQPSNNWALENRPLLSSPGPLYQNKVTCSAFDIEMIFHSHANKTHFHKKGCALGLFLKVRVCGTRKWPIEQFYFNIVSFLYSHDFCVWLSNVI